MQAGGGSRDSGYSGSTSERGYEFPRPYHGTVAFFRRSYNRTKGGNHVDSRHDYANPYVVAVGRLEPKGDQVMPVFVIPAIIGGTIVLIGGGYWLMHLH